MVIGVINGYIVSSTNIPAFIVTLAMMNIGRGIARVYTKAQTISVLDDSYTFWGMGSIFGIPIQLYCIVAVVAVSSFILNKTQLGRHIYAVGGNSQSATLMGLDVRKTKMKTYVLASFLTSIGGICYALNTMSGTTSQATGFEMDAISSAVIGGTLLTGGVGNVVGTLVGVLINGTISTLVKSNGKLVSSWANIVTAILLCFFIVLQAILARVKESKKAA